jgi:hypothetical protein
MIKAPLATTADDLPTPRSISRTGYRVRVWCKACRHAKDADLVALIDAGRGWLRRGRAGAVPPPLCSRSCRPVHSAQWTATMMRPCSATILIAVSRSSTITMGFPSAP